MQIGPGGERRGVAEDDGVAVGRRVRDLPGADHAGAAGVAVLDDDLLAEFRAHLVGHRARHDVVGAAGRQRNDQHDRLAGIVVGRGRQNRASAAAATSTAPSRPSPRRPSPRRPSPFLGPQVLGAQVLGAQALTIASSIFLLRHPPAPADIASRSGSLAAGPAHCHAAPCGCDDMSVRRHAARSTRSKAELARRSPLWLRAWSRHRRRRYRPSSSAPRRTRGTPRPKPRRRACRCA